MDERRISPLDRRRARLDKAAAQYGYAGGCIVPGCTRDVRLHHFVPKREGGTDAIANLVPMCAYHEAPLHHAGQYARKYFLSGEACTLPKRAMKRRQRHAPLPPPVKRYGCMDCGFTHRVRPSHCEVCKVSGEKMGHLKTR